MQSIQSVERVTIYMTAKVIRVVASWAYFHNLCTKADKVSIHVPYRLHFFLFPPYKQTSFATSKSP